MGNCINRCRQSRAGKQGDGMKPAEYIEEKKWKPCRDGEGVVRVKVLVTRRELEQLLRHSSDKKKNKHRTDDEVSDGEIVVKLMGVGGRGRRGGGREDEMMDDWKPNLETIPEE